MRHYNSFYNAGLRPYPLLAPAECGELFRRVHWNNHGCRSIVWRCLSRLQSTGVVCHARTVNEEVLKKVVMQAFNELTEFIEQQDSELTEFDESLARRWFKEIIVWDDRFSVELKSGVRIEIEIVSLSKIKTPHFWNCFKNAEQ